MIMHVGTDRSGTWLEIGAVLIEDDVAIVHAMPARPKFLRLVR